MTTKQVPNSPSLAGLPASDLVALPPGPGRAPTPKLPPGTKDFASAIEQATANNTRKPAQVRTTKSAGRARREDTAGTPARQRTSTSARDTRGPQPNDRHIRGGEPARNGAPTEGRRTPSFTGETQADAPSEQVHDDAESGRTPMNGKAARKSGPTNQSETPAENLPTDDAGSEDAVEDTAPSAQTTTPANIIPFPGTANAVIIPFPITQAHAVPPLASGMSATATDIAADSGAPAATASAPAALAGKVTTAGPSSTGKTPEGPSQGSIDVSALGLKPVSHGEVVSQELVTNHASTAQASRTTAGTEEPAAANVVQVMFNAAQAGGLPADAGSPDVTAQTQLPVAPGEAEETARQPLDTPASASSAKIVLLRTDAAKPAPDAAGDAVTPPPRQAAGPAGISGARQEDRMESMTASEHAAAANTAVTESAFEAQKEFTTGQRAGTREVSADLPDRTKVATDWQTGRPVSGTDRTILDPPAPEASAAAASVERISSLVLREAALVKKYGSDSMAVVLRPDAETELFVHLTQRNGQVEATVRCERGDAQHLGALWPQLQESLAQQKVRLAPLEESSGSRGSTNFQPPAGSLMSGGGERGPREDARPSQQQSMDEWPATPAPATATPHVRGGRGTRGRRISTSRPGWETWA